MPGIHGFNDLFRFDPNADDEALNRQLQRLIEYDHWSAETKGSIAAEQARRLRHGELRRDTSRQMMRPRKRRRPRIVPLPPERFLSEINFTRDPEDGIYSIQIPGKKPFRLTRLLGHFLFILCNDSLPTDDELVAWKERKLICKLLSELEQREIRIENLNQMVYRLRGALDNGAGVGGDLVQVSSDGSIRFAVRHQPK